MTWSLSRVVRSVLLLLPMLAASPLSGQTASMEALLDRVRTATAAGHFAEAAGLYARATRLSPNTPELWSNRGVVEFLAGNKAAAIPSLRRALRLNPSLRAPMVFLGKAYLDTGQASDALVVLNRALAQGPRDGEVLLALGRANADLHRPQAAANFYAEATTLVPQQPSAWFGLGVASLQLIEQNGGAMAEAHADSLWARSLYADELLTQGRPVEAVATYRTALAKASPVQAAELVATLMWMHANPDLSGLPAASQKQLEELLAKTHQGAVAPLSCSDPQPSAESATELHAAACAYRAGDYAGSAADAAEVLAGSPASDEALYWSIKSNERVAVAALGRFEELSAHSAETYVLIGNLYRRQRQPENALLEYSKALAVDAHSASALRGSVLAALAANRLEQAFQLAAAALADRPADPELNLLMAEVLDAQNQPAEEVPYLAKATHAEPELQPRVHYLLAHAYSTAGNTAQAIAQYELALPGDTDGSMHYQLSRLYRKAGETAKADAVMAQAKALIQKRNANAVTAVREATPSTP